MTTSLLPLLFALIAAQDPPRTATEMVPLQALCGQELLVAPPHWSSLLRHVPQLDRTVDLVAGTDGAHVTSPDVIAELLYGIEHEAIDNGVLFLRPIGGNLMVLGESAAVRRARGWLDEATQIVARPIEVEFSVWDAADRETPPAVLDAAEYGRFTKSGAPIWRSLAIARAGDPLSLDHLTWKQYVRSLEAEVAQKQNLSRPAMDLYAVGGQAVVKAFPLVATDEFVVCVQFAAAQERELRRTLQTGLPGAAELELPRLESCFGACSARVANGGALCATLRGNNCGGGQLMLLVRVRSSAPPSTMSRNDIAVLPCGALTTGALNQVVPLPRPLEQEGAPAGFGEGVYGMVPTDVLIEMAQSVLAGHEDATESEVRCDGVHLFVRGPSAGVAAVSALLQSLQDQLIQNVELRHVASLEVPTSGNTASGSDNGANPLAGAKLHEITLPTLLGREAAAFRMLETNVVSNVFIEIAQEASLLVPEVTALQAGTWLRARCTPLPTGTRVELELLTCDAAIPIARTVQQGGGVLMPREVATTRLRHHGPVAAGRAIEHGNGPRVTIDGRAFDSTMMTTIRR